MRMVVEFRYGARTSNTAEPALHAPCTRAGEREWRQRICIDDEDAAAGFCYAQELADRRFLFEFIDMKDDMSAVDRVEAFAWQSELRDRLVRIRRTRTKLCAGYIQSGC